MLEDLLGSQRATLVSTTIVMSGLAITKPAGLKCRTPAKIAGVWGWIQRSAWVTPEKVTDRPTAGNGRGNRAGRGSCNKDRRRPRSADRQDR
jgi:hypothetical protein